MEAAPADAFKLEAAADGVAIEFGRLQPAAGATAVAVTDRVVLSVETCRRLALWLEEALAPHAGAMQAAAAKALSPGEAAVAARPGAAPGRPAGDASGEWAARLLGLVGAWGVPHQYERSMRMSDRGVQANRFLLTLNARDIPDEPRQSVLAACDRMGIPPALRAQAEAQFDMANCVHFGFEGDPDSIICKLYLERAVPAEEARAAAAAERPVLLHLALKWAVNGEGAVTTRYLWHPHLDEAAIARRLAWVYRDREPGSLEIARELLRSAAERAPAERLQYLEVEEAQNARRSFDLNIYDAGLQVKDIQDLLHRMRARYGIRPGQFQALYDQIKGMALGHLAGGVHREGQDFFNLYYGVVGLPRFGRTLG